MTVREETCDVVLVYSNIVNNSPVYSRIAPNGREKVRRRSASPKHLTGYLIKNVLQIYRESNDLWRSEATVGTCLHHTELYMNDKEQVECLCSVLLGKGSLFFYYQADCLWILYAR